MLRFQSILEFLFFALILVSTLLPASQCSEKPVGVARKEDIPYIKCQVCQKLASQLYHQVQNKQSQISPKKISEFQIIETAENICNLKKAEADWILKIDIVENGKKLKLVAQESEGQCNSECKTIERACQEVMGYSDTDVAEYIYTNKPKISSIENYLCKDLTKACSSKPPSVPKDRSPGEPFVPKAAKEAEMEKLMKSMEGMPGASNMKMYSREDLMNMNNLGGKNADEDDDDDDEDDDESDFPANLGKDLRNKESKKVDWKERVRKGIKETSVALQKHVNKVSYQVRKWWKGKKNSSGKSEL